MGTFWKVVLVFGLCLTFMEPSYGQRRGGLVEEAVREEGVPEEVESGEELALVGEARRGGDWGDGLEAE